MNEIYSYYEEGSEYLLKERLIEHINECLSAISNIKNSKIYKYLMKIPCEWTLSLDDVIRLSIIFHDIGKVFYQNNYKYDKEHNVKYLSFKGHEFLSFYIFNELFKFEFIDTKKEDFILSVCSFSILFHHHAMGVKKKIMNDYGKEKVVNLNDTQINKLKETISKFLRNDREINALDRIINKMKNISSEKALEIICNTLKDDAYKNIWNMYVSDSNFRKLSLAFLSTLLVADYYAANKIRKRIDKKPPDFYFVLMDFYEYYLK
ncbi:MAG: CRISPR-associated endonuclease Cas3'' [Candidatus Verstraetearchaeota archaeon]|nr:CRISPR-associated endonuclease Cas3'' [Candidatus Verstraetearchaeota archaeon]